MSTAPRQYSKRFFGIATVSALSLVAVAGCGGGDRTQRADSSTTAAPPAAQAAPAETAPAPAGRAAPETVAARATPPAKATGGGAKPSPRVIALGDSIFRGQVAGGTCTVCHGQDAKGTPVGPDLTDQQWLNGDGTYEFLVQIITNGVPKPKQYPAPMPPMGGASLSPEQVRAVAAYEYSLSRKGS